MYNDQSREIGRYLQAFAAGQITPSEIYTLTIQIKRQIRNPSIPLNDALKLIDDLHDSRSANDFRKNNQSELQKIIISLNNDLQ